MSQQLVNPRLNDIDDCLYRVATKAIIIEDGKLLLVKEIPELFWGFPGGGVDFGESVEASLFREVEEELGVPVKEIKSDLQIVHYTIGTVVDGIPRMNIFYRVSLPKDLIKKTDEIAEWGWFTKTEFMDLNMSPSFKDRHKLAEVIFGETA